MISQRTRSTLSILLTISAALPFAIVIGIGPSAKPEPDVRHVASFDVAVRVATSIFGEKPPRVPCGGRACVVGEHCCASSMGAFCESDAREGAYCAEDEQWAAGSARKIVSCDDSEDCRDAELCCRDYAREDVVRSSCVPKIGEYACVLDEACTETCKTPGTRCIDGHCRRAHATCGEKICAGATPVCCEERGENTCASWDGCRGKKLECTQRADCAAGMHCCASEDGSRCAGECDGPDF